MCNKYTTVLFSLKTLAEFLYVITFWWLETRSARFKNQSKYLQGCLCSNKDKLFHEIKATLPLTISWAKLDTPEPRSDWVTQRYKSWSVLVTSCNLKEAANLLWLMFLVWATGISSPFRLCKQKPSFKNSFLTFP